MTTKRYEFTGETKLYYGVTLRRIRRLSDGVLGGWIKREENLPHDGTGWVSDEGMVSGDALVRGGVVRGGARVSGDAQVSGTAMLRGTKWLWRARLSRLLSTWTACAARSRSHD